MLSRATTVGAARSRVLEIDANPPTREQQAQFLSIIRSLTNDSQDALGFWAFRFELDFDAFDWPAA